MTWFEKMHSGNANATAYGGIRLSDLQRHDRIFHKGGYKPSQKCSLRNQVKAETERDMEMEGANAKPRYVPRDEPVNSASGTVAKMEAMAREWHKTSKPRRGADVKPYIVHPESVVRMLKNWGFTDDADPVTMGIAWGHDLLEETDITPEKIQELIGIDETAKDVLSGIKALTLDNSIWFENDADFDAFKQRYIEKIARFATPEALAVKIADRLSNTLDFCMDNNPKAKRYLQLGEPLFARVDELPHAENIKKTITDVRKLAEIIPFHQTAKEQNNGL